MKSLQVLVALVAFLVPLTSAFNLFEQMFQQAGQQQQRQQGPAPDAASDSSTYQMGFEGTTCSKYLCPGTLACVHFPHHCPCAFPATEDKVELGEGIAVCASKGGFKVGEVQRKIELARKGLL